MDIKSCCIKYLELITPLGEEISEIRVCICETRFLVNYLNKKDIKIIIGDLNKVAVQEFICH